MRSTLACFAGFVISACGAAEPVPGDDATGITENSDDGSPTNSSTTPTGTDSSGDTSGTTTGGPTPIDPPGVGPNVEPPATGTPSDTGVVAMPTGSVTGQPPVNTVPTGGQGGVTGQGGTPLVDGTAGTPVSVGGSGGQPPATGGAGGMVVSPGLGCTGNELLCEDFEAVADGEVPTAPWQPLDDSCQYQTASFTMGVTSELANGGSRSLKVTNKHFAQCRLSASFGAADDFWVRAYMYWETGLDISNRETLAIDLTPGFRTADDPAVRFGYRSKAPCEEYAGPQVTIIGVAGGEVTGCGSRPMPQGEWFCFEAHVQQASVVDVRTYINNEAISYQSTGKPLTESIATEAAPAQKIDHIRLGIFSTGEAVGSIYIDDVAVATSRLGCGN